MSKRISKFESCILDFDGVIADTVGAHTDARSRALKGFGYEVPDCIQEEAHSHGSHPEEIIGWVLAAIGKIPTENASSNPKTLEVVSAKNELYHDLCERGLEPIPGALEMIKFCIARFGLHRVAIATTANRWEVDPFMRHHGIPPIGFIATREQVGKERLKPEPDLYQLCMQYLGQGALSFALEDSPRGIAASKTAGLYTFGISTTHDRSDLGGADRIVSSHEELLALLD